MDVSMELVLFFVGQTVALLVAMVAAYVRTQVAITTLKTPIAALEVHVGNIHETTKGLKDDHKRLTEKVDGISRHVAKIEAGCQFMKKHI